MAAITGFATIDFGSTPVTEGDFTITDAGFAGQANAEAYVMVESTVDNDALAHREAGAFMRLVCEPPGSGTMALHAYILAGMVTGTFKVRYVAV